MWPPLLEEKRPSDGADGVFELPLHVSVEQRRLPNVHVSQENKLRVGLLHLRHVGHDGPQSRYYCSSTNASVGFVIIYMQAQIKRSGLTLKYKPTQMTNSCNEKHFVR